AIGRILGAAIARDAIDQQLGATIQRLQRSEEIRVSFLRATSHELRTPLTVIAGVAETLQHHQDHLDPSQRRELLDRLTTNTDRLRRLIGDLLDVDRLASGLVVARRSAHDLRELVERVVAESEYDTHRITLELEPVMAEVDVPKLERVVANLVANAVRHTPEGTAITVRLGRQGADAWLRVEDDGPGIDPHHLERIFEPFVQGRDRHHHAQPGTGLGLALAREIVQLHGGDIRADNRPEGGARFEVTLPVDDTSRDAPDTPGS
ncbi:MAG: ATP-binding protein, partial [Nitriliruptoraceae bacterium]